MAEVLPPRKKYIKSKLVEKNPAPKGKPRGRPTKSEDKAKIKFYGGENKRDKIVADYKLGCMSNQDIAYRHDVSEGTVRNHTKGLEKDNKYVYESGMEYYKNLANLDSYEFEVVKEIVELRNSQLHFISCATIKNVAHVSQKINSNMTLDEHLKVQHILKKGRETVEPRRDNQAVTINQTTGINIKTLSDEELIQESRRLDEKLRIVGDGK